MWLHYIFPPASFCEIKFKYFSISTKKELYLLNISQKKIPIVSRFERSINQIAQPSVHLYHETE